MMNELEESIRILSRGIIDGDNALLSLCNALVEKVMTIEHQVNMTEFRVTELLTKVKDLSEKLEVIRDVFYTHITDEKEPN
jgi:hypothetical protein